MHIKSVAQLILGLVAASSLLASVRSSEAEPLYRLESFSVTEGGGFLTKTWKELGSKEAAQLITTACAVYGTDCSSEAEAIRRAAEETYKRFSKSNFKGTFDAKQNGEEWRGFIKSPPNFAICSVRTISKSITKGTTFNAMLVAGADKEGNRRNGLSIYAVVQKNRSDGRRWANFEMVIKFVPIAEYPHYSTTCWKSGTMAVKCKGPITCSSKSPVKQLKARQ